MCILATSIWEKKKEILKFRKKLKNTKGLEDCEYKLHESMKTINFKERAFPSKHSIIFEGIVISISYKLFTHGELSFK